MYNLLEYSKKFRKTTGSFWTHQRDEPNNSPFNHRVVENPPSIDYNAESISNSESYKQKSNITVKTSNADQENGKQGTKKTKTRLEIVVP